jgi:hypothetical protein
LSANRIPLFDRSAGEVRVRGEQTDELSQYEMPPWRRQL